MSQNRCSPSGFEVATGMVIGIGGFREALPDPCACPIQALEHEILPALLRPPCLVSFSGGRDSSGVLAVASARARREGLPAPIPVTNVFRGAPETTETHWQEHVVRSLRLGEWLRLEHTDELDLIGPYARRVLRRHGLVWPFNVHFHLPLLDAARGGSLLTGIGGDELFGAARQHPIATLHARQRQARPRDLLRIGLAFAPRGVRRRVKARREPLRFPWLRPKGQKRATSQLADWSAGQPWRLHERMAWLRNSRYLEVLTAALQLTASDTDVHLAHPLLSPQVWSTVAVAGQPTGFINRTQGMRHVFGDVLPDVICARRSKALFDQAFWTRGSREFVRSWDGSGVPEEWTDARALAAHWREPRPWANSFTLLQAAWLNSRDGAEQPLHHVVGQVPSARPLQLDHR